MQLPSRAFNCRRGLRKVCLQAIFKCIGEGMGAPLLKWGYTARTDCRLSLARPRSTWRFFVLPGSRRVTQVLGDERDCQKESTKDVQKQQTREQLKHLDPDPHTGCCRRLLQVWFEMRGFKNAVSQGAAADCRRFDLVLEGRSCDSLRMPLLAAAGPD